MLCESLWIMLKAQKISKNQHFSTQKFERISTGAGGKPSTWFPPGRLVEHIKYLTPHSTLNGISSVINQNKKQKESEKNCGGGGLCGCCVWWLFWAKRCRWSGWLANLIFGPVFGHEYWQSWIPDAPLSNSHMIPPNNLHPISFFNDDPQTQ